jgi:copper(I)-binding protein
MKRLALVFLLLAGPAVASVDVTVNHGAVWKSPDISLTTAGLLQIHNTGNADETLTEVSCPIADDTKLEGAQGQALLPLTIPAGQTVTFTLEGPHLVLSGLHFIIVQGSVVPCSFTFTGAGNLGVFLNEVEAPSPRPALAGT